MSNYEILNLVISLFGTLFVGLSVLYLAKQIKLSLKIHSANHEWNRRMATNDILNRIRDIDTDELNKKFGYLNRTEPISLKEVKDAFSENSTLQLLLNRMLNYYEGLSNGIFLGTYDENTIKSNRKGAMEREFRRFKKYIEYRRGVGNKNSWNGFERLIKKWEREELKANDKEILGKL